MPAPSWLGVAEDTAEPDAATATAAPSDDAAATSDTADDSSSALPAVTSAVFAVFKPHEVSGDDAAARTEDAPVTLSVATPAMAPEEAGEAESTKQPEPAAAAQAEPAAAPAPALVPHPRRPSAAVDYNEEEFLPEETAGREEFLPHPFVCM